MGFKRKDVKPRYDERQIFVRYKAGYEAFCLLSIMLLLNWMIAPEYFQLISGVHNSYIFFVIAADYFIIRCILKDAVNSIHKSTPVFSLRKLIAITGFTLLGAIISISLFLENLITPNFNNGESSKNLAVFLISMLVIIGCAALIKGSSELSVYLAQYSKRKIS